MNSVDSNLWHTRFLGILVHYYIKLKGFQCLNYLRLYQIRTMGRIHELYSRTWWQQKDVTKSRRSMLIKGPRTQLGCWIQLYYLFWKLWIFWCRFEPFLSLKNMTRIQQSVAEVSSSHHPLASRRQSLIGRNVYPRPKMTDCKY